MKIFKKLTRVIAFLASSLVALSGHAQWNQNSSVGPYTYTDPANWVSGIITNLFSTAPANGLIVQFTNNFILTNGESLYFPGNSNVTFESSTSTAWTLQLSGGNFLRTNNTGGTITIGTTNNPLVLDINGAARTIGGGTAGSTSSANICTNDIYAQIIDSSSGTNGIFCGGGNIYAYLLNTNNTFRGRVQFQGLRGGGFANIKLIGSAASALGAPTTTSNATITVADSGSFGQLQYLGSGDVSDRPFVFNISFSNAIGNAYQFVNDGTGLLQLLGQFTFPTNVTYGSQFIFNAFDAPIELEGYIDGHGNPNGTWTEICFLGGPGSVATNVITLTGATNDFKDFVISNVVVAYNTVAAAGTPSPIGAGTNIYLWGGRTESAIWAGNTGQGSTLQYNGTNNATFTRNIVVTSGTGSTYYWGIDNAGSNTTLTLSNNISWSVPPASTGFYPRYLFINPNPNCTNIVLSQIPDGNITVSGSVEGTIVAAANPVGSTINNGGVLALLNPSNTFAGGVQAAYARTIQVATLANIGSPSSIGTASNTGTVGTINLTGIILGSTDSQRGGIFSYVGTTNALSNQKITILGDSTGTLCSGTVRNDSANGSSVHFTDTTTWNIDPIMPLCQVILAGAAVATNIIDSSIVNAVSNTQPTGLTVSGSTWELTAAQYYSSNTTVSNGTLLVHGSIQSGLGLTIQTNGILAGDGTVNEAVTVQPSGTLAAGIGLGTLTINGNVTNNGTILLKLDAATGQSDMITGIGTLVNSTNTGQGVLTVTNLAGTFTNHQSFQLFSAATYSGSFTAISPTTPGPGFTWNTNALTTSGVLAVAATTPPSPPSFTSVSVANSNIILTATGGPASSPVYVLYTTNLVTPWSYLSTNQFDTNGNLSVTNLIQPGAPAEFYILEVP